MFEYFFYFVYINYILGFVVNFITSVIIFPLLYIILKPIERRADAEQITDNLVKIVNPISIFIILIFDYIHLAVLARYLHGFVLHYDINFFWGGLSYLLVSAFLIWFFKGKQLYEEMKQQQMERPFYHGNMAAENLGLWVWYLSPIAYILLFLSPLVHPGIIFNTVTGDVGYAVMWTTTIPIISFILFIIVGFAVLGMIFEFGLYFLILIMLPFNLVLSKIRGGNKDDKTT